MAVGFRYAATRLEKAVFLVERFKDLVALGTFHADDFSADFPFGQFQFVERQLEESRARNAFSAVDGVVLPELRDEENRRNVGFKGGIELGEALLSRRKPVMSSFFGHEKPSRTASKKAFPSPVSARSRI